MASEPHCCIQGGGQVKTLPRVILHRGSEVIPTPIHWLWDGWLASGKLHLIGGAPSTGKTTIALAMAATITSGGQWPDGSRAVQGSVLYWSGEDDNEDTLNPRLRAAGADMSRVFTVGNIHVDGEPYPFDPAQHMPALCAKLATLPDVRFIVIDPIVSAIGGDSHKNAEVRRALQPVVDLAGQLGCAVLGVTHFTKGTSGNDPVERITGSLAFAALPRVVMITAKQSASKDRPERRILVRAKSNLGPDGDGFVYGIKQGPLLDYPSILASSVEWGDTIKGTARDLLAVAERRNENQGYDAVDFLRDFLARGPRPVNEILTEAKSAGFAKDVMDRAKARIGIKPVKRGMHGGWEWRLPDAEDSEEGTQKEAPSSLPSENAKSPPNVDREIFIV